MQSLSRPSYLSSPKSGGFTLIEVLVMAPIVLIAIGIFVGAIISVTGDALTARASNTLAYETQNALSMIEEDVRLSGTFLATNSVTIASPHGYNDTGQAFENIYPTGESVLILRTPATNSPHYVPLTRPLYLANQPNACNSPLVSQNDIMTVNVVYFVRDNTLWRRTLPPSDYQTIACDSTALHQIPSCTDLVASTCQTLDTRLATGIADDGFVVRYLTTAQEEEPLADAVSGTTAVRQSALNSARAVQVTISQSQQVAGRDLSYTGTMRAVRLNNI